MSESSGDDIEVYVRDATSAAIVDALDGEVGPLTLASQVAPGWAIHANGRVRLAVQEGFGEGHTSVWLRGSGRWPSSLAFARFLSERLACPVRCDPGEDYPDVAPESDVFVEVDRGAEQLVDWRDG